MHKRGEEIGGLLLEYTRQMITLQVTALYYQCLALEETESALASRVAAAEALQDQMSAYYKEGLVSEWQLKQVEVLKDQAGIAITNFLPSLIGFASFNNTSDSFVF